jgi:hypothetical protein
LKALIHRKGIQSRMSSSWLDFYPPLIPFWDITLHLDVYVQPAHSEEEWAKSKLLVLNQERGCHRIDPSHETAVSKPKVSLVLPTPPEHGLTFTPSEEDLAALPATMTDQSSKWSISLVVVGLRHKSTRNLLGDLRLPSTWFYSPAMASYRYTRRKLTAPLVIRRDSHIRSYYTCRPVCQVCTIMEARKSIRLSASM